MITKQDIDAVRRQVQDKGEKCTKIISTCRKYNITPKELKTMSDDELTRLAALCNIDKESVIEFAKGFTISGDMLIYQITNKE